MKVLVVHDGSCRPELKQIEGWLKAKSCEVMFFDLTLEEHEKSFIDLINGSVAQRYGDNVYHRSAAELPWMQEDSFHSLEGSIVNSTNLSRDTGSTDRVLIGDWFMYWGELAPKVPTEFLDFVHTTQGEILIKDELRIAAFVSWASSQGEASRVLGDPCEWAYEEKRARKQGYAWVP